jgi:hypothetical protein
MTERLYDYVWRMCKGEDLLICSITQLDVRGYKLTIHHGVNVVVSEYYHYLLEATSTAEAFRQRYLSDGWTTAPT